MASNLQFGTYVFAHNPRKIELVCVQKLAAYLLPFCGTVTQSLGAGCRSARCEGEVFAADAREAAEEAAAIGALRGREELLYLPTGERFRAVVSRFSCTAQGDGRVLPYRIDFSETNSTGEAEQ